MGRYVREMQLMLTSVVNIPVQTNIWPMRLAGVRQWSDFVCLFGLKLLGAQKNHLTAVNNPAPIH